MKVTESKGTVKKQKALTNPQVPLNNYAVVDLFCGVGGLSHGLVLEGFNIVAGIDSDNSCKYAFEHNNKATFLHRKIEQITPDEINALYPHNSVKVLVGCAPCQTFSSYNRLKKEDDEKWNLLSNFGNIVQAILPDFVSMENVPLLTKHKVFDEFLDTLRRNNYLIDYKRIYCPDYGIPQTRTRLVLVASRKGNIEIIPPTHTKENYTTVEKTIGHLEPLEAGQRSKTDPLHTAKKLSSTNLERIKHSKPGGTWRDWPKELRAKCHQAISGSTFSSVYGRMSWNQPSPTMTTLCNGYGNGRFGHPEQNRAISLREAALLQTFPEYYSFFDPQEDLKLTSISRQIGNAVPVTLGRVVGQSIINSHK